MLSQYVLKQYERSGGNIKVELDLSNYVITADLEGATCFATSNLAAKEDLDKVHKVK